MRNISNKRKAARQIARSNGQTENNHKVNRKNGTGKNETISAGFDYDGFARVAGRIAFEEAKEAGLSEEVAKKFERIFGAPIEPEYRLS